MTETIVAPASGAPPAGVSVVRVSGPEVRNVAQAILGGLPEPRRAVVRGFRDEGGHLIDRGIVVFFAAPGSFTGEDVLELHSHGSPAVLAALLDRLTAFPGVRLALPGEFTRRAFENGQMDLSAAEGLADLIDAETEAQRRQALSQMEGGLSDLADGWRGRLIDAMALAEAEIDFPDEDLPDGIGPVLAAGLRALAHELQAALDGSGHARMVRSGLKVALVGPPNAGKSSLINALAGSDVAIVSPVAGTTRDVLEVRLRLAGHLVLVSDMAGLRDAPDDIEAEGVRRARARASEADVRVFMAEDHETLEAMACDGHAWDLRVLSKADLCHRPPVDGVHAVSVVTGLGLSALTETLAHRAASAGGGPGVLTRARHVEAARDALAAVERVLAAEGILPELAAEELRLAARAIGRITGRVDVEDILDAVFSRFCIGK